MPSDKDLLHFLANRGYAVVDPGDVSMSVDLRASGRGAYWQSPNDLAGMGLRLERVDQSSPFPGRGTARSTGI